MNEVEKMMQNANIKQDRMCEWTCKGNEFCSTNCEHYESTQVFYPPFTAEKQLSLIKWLIQSNISDERIIRSNYEKTYYYCLFTWEYPFYESEAFTKFEEALAYIFNYHWQFLTEEERKQIKEILE